MTGVTQVVRCAQRVFWHGRFGLLALLAQLPPSLQQMAQTVLMVRPGERDFLTNPIGDMPVPKLEFFQERRPATAGVHQVTAVTMPAAPLAQLRPIPPAVRQNAAEALRQTARASSGVLRY
mmetsp:Transcript_15543/g.33740  ORF Transcript_15543/g.33740 Transcript_15543/m.33740 type:complete len:121 (-) Transcript_15543:165-527(-)|eukprot:CAMPEP_0202907240 /NCGR_PEP_ID=MMETSP1392-20130828/41812_1 /ASSEMBLY_ACC=CAM_ASM_000868 /TAXON_ID=225041 /ORGANISM="Chlamydomonas chlamydogama, Strain SAG 11-48b" /LENGTH=120 /DNA_ID=CAMNT_0049596051 /DNA_START=62 /DNA_END=424 /DNA_ORIENTATION=+